MQVARTHITSHANGATLLGDAQVSGVGPWNPGAQPARSSDSCARISRTLGTTCVPYSSMFLINL